MTKQESHVARTRRKKWLAVACMLALPVIWLFQSSAGDKHWFASLLSHTPQPIFILPALVLVLAAIITRDKIVLLTSCISAVFASTVLAGLYWNPANSVPANHKTLKVMTFNIMAEVMGTEGIIETIRQADPDVVCLQEAGRIWEGGQPTNELIQSLNGYELHRSGQILIASRYPVLERNQHIPPHSPDTRPILEVVIDVDGKQVTVYNLHVLPFLLDRDFNKRRFYVPDDINAAIQDRQKQIAFLLELTSESEGPAVICGDFNSPARGVLYRQLTSLWTDSFAASGRGYGYTFTSNLPLQRIDFVFVRGMKPVNASPIKSRSSDHRPLTAILAFPEE